MFKSAISSYKKALTITSAAADIQYKYAILQGDFLGFWCLLRVAGHLVQPRRTPTKYLSTLFDLECRRIEYLAAIDDRNETKSVSRSRRFYEVHGLLYNDIPRVRSFLWILQQQVGTF